MTFMQMLQNEIYRAHGDYNRTMNAATRCLILFLGQEKHSFITLQIEAQYDCI